MKKHLIFIATLFSLNFTSCIYTDETYVPQPPVYNYSQNIDVLSYTQFGRFIDIDFTYPFISGRDYFSLYVEKASGPLVFNGRRWEKVSDDFWYPPITLYVDGITIRSFVTYRCFIMSSWGNTSQEFLMRVY